MSLSQSVDDFITEAKGNIRSAIAAAARNERPIVIQQLSEVLRSLDSINKIEKATDSLETVLDKMRQRIDKGEGNDEIMFGPF